VRGFNVQSVAIDGHAYRVQVLGVRVLVTLDVLSDEDAALLLRTQGLIGLTWDEVYRLLDVQRRVAARCVVEEDIHSLPLATIVTLAGIAVAIDPSA